VVIPLLTREAARAIDIDAGARLGVAGIVLMENAGRAAFELIRVRFGEQLAAVAVLGGVGQNGGDAWVVARHLSMLGLQPRCVLLGPREKVAGDAALTLNELEKLGLRVQSVTSGDMRALGQALAGATLIVDGLFGTGLDREIVGVCAAAIEAMNAAGAPCVALDLPSGVDADSGAVLGVAVQAQLTVTFAAHKRGLHQHPGAALAGEVVCVPIGVPGPRGAPVEAMEAADVAAWLPRRRPDTHKGAAGHVLVVAGAPGRTGAALLAGMAALRAGAGLVTLCPRAGARAALDAKIIELMSADVPEDSGAAMEVLHALAASAQALVVGPGFGTDTVAREVMRKLAVTLAAPLVLDADALTAIGTDVGMLASAAAARVLTPHPGEAARMLGITSAAVQADRYAAAAKLARLSQAVVVLKGARTIVAEPSGRMRVCPRDVPALAVAGTGDVLAGAVAALCAELAPFDAACAAVYLHALAGELAARSDRGLLAREVADALPDALEACRAAVKVTGGPLAT